MTSETSRPPAATISAPTAAPAPGPNRVQRALGITDRYGWFLGWWQAFVVGTAFVVISLIGYHSPQPRDVPVAVIGTPSQVAEVQGAVEEADPGAYALSSRSVADAAQALHRGEVYAVIDLSGKPTIRYAGAQGPTVFAALVRTLVPPVSATTGGAPALVDTLPLGANDAAALPLFYLSFAVVLASYLFSITTTNQARKLGAWATGPAPPHSQSASASSPRSRPLRHGDHHCTRPDGGLGAGTDLLGDRRDVLPAPHLVQNLRVDPGHGHLGDPRQRKRRCRPRSVPPDLVGGTTASPAYGRLTGHHPRPDLLRGRAHPARCGRLAAVGPHTAGARLGPRAPPIPRPQAPTR